MNSNLRRNKMYDEYGVFGEDVLVEIFLRLPKKSLCRFRCVSKAWNSLLSHPTLRLSPTVTETGLLCQCLPSPLPRKTFPMAFLFAHPDGTASNFPPLSFPLSTSLSLCHSCNGLLLLQQVCFGLPSLPMGYVVYNPATRNSVAIPFQSAIEREREPERDLLRVGFAFDGRCYRVIRVCSGSDAGSLEFDIFSSQTGEWRMKQLSIPDQQSVIFYALPPMHSNQSVFLKESLYWLLGKFLLVFHTKDESLMLVELPGQYKSGSSVDKCIWESEGCLNYCRCDKKGICVWVLGAEDSKLKWRMKHSGNLEISPASEISSCSSSFEPCAFNDDFGIVYMQCNRRLFSYKLETGVLKEVRIDSLEASCAENICAVYPFMYCSVDLP